MAYTQYRSPFGDTTYTKVFVGGLAWETPTEEMRRYFEQFGEILEAVIITDKSTAKSKGYGFVTFRDPESARRACADPNPVIDGRRANCNIASFGRPRPSPPRGRNAVPISGSYQVGTAGQVGPSYSGGVPAPLAPPLPPPPPPFVYPPPPYGYQTYTPEYGYQQATLYNPQIQQAQYYPQMYGTSSSSMGSPYYYGYTLQAPRGSFSTPQGHHRLPGPSSYLYYPAPLEGSFSTYPLHLHSPTSRLPFSPSTVTDSEAPQRTTTSTMGPESGPVTSETSNP